MAPETLYLSSTVSGIVVNPQNVIGNTPSTWAGEINSNTSWTHRWSFAAPQNNELTGSQEVTVFVRKGSNNSNPTVSSINVYQNGALVHTTGSTLVTSTAGQTISFFWTPNSTSTSVDIEVVTSSNSGRPADRNSVQMAYASWVAQTVEQQVVETNWYIVESGVEVPIFFEGVVESGSISAGTLAPEYIDTGGRVEW